MSSRAASSTFAAPITEAEEFECHLDRDDAHSVFLRLPDLPEPAFSELFNQFATRHSREYRSDLRRVRPRPRRCERSKEPWHQLVIPNPPLQFRQFLGRTVGQHIPSRHVPPDLFAQRFPARQPGIPRVAVGHCYSGLRTGPSPSPGNTSRNCFEKRFARAPASPSNCPLIHPHRGGDLRHLKVQCKF